MVFFLMANSLSQTKKANQMLATIGVQPSEVSRMINLSKDIITQNSEKSSSDTNYSLSEEQQEYFKDSVVRDDSGNLKVMYHGTSKGGFKLSIHTEVNTAYSVKAHTLPTTSRYPEVLI